MLQKVDNRQIQTITEEYFSNKQSEKILEIWILVEHVIDSVNQEIEKEDIKILTEDTKKRAIWVLTFNLEKSWWDLWEATTEAINFMKKIEKYDEYKEFYTKYWPKDGKIKDINEFYKRTRIKNTYKSSVYDRISLIKEKNIFKLLKKRWSVEIKARRWSRTTIWKPWDIYECEVVWLFTNWLLIVKNKQTNNREKLSPMYIEEVVAI